MTRAPLSIAGLIAAPLFAALVALAIWNPRGDYWGAAEFRKAQCEAYDTATLRTTTRLSEAVYAPTRLARLFREPQNTISNLAHAIVGLAILLAATQPASRALGLAGLFLGFGSGVYHASLLPEWRMIDIHGVFAATGFDRSTFALNRGERNNAA